MLEQHSVQLLLTQILFCLNPKHKNVDCYLICWVSVIDYAFRVLLQCKGNSGDLGNSVSLNVVQKNKLQLCYISVSVRRWPGSINDWVSAILI